MISCHVCGKRPVDGTNVYRQNAKGEPGIFACAAHSKPVDDTLVRIVAQIQQSGNGKLHPLPNDRQ